MKRLNDLRDKWSGSGQSLVEFSLFLPILLFLLIGLVEVGNLLNTKNRVVTASRMGAGYGAANFDGGPWSIIADNMGVAALNTVTETMPLDRNLWDVWSIRALTNGDGSDFVAGTAGFESNHVFGDFAVVASGEWTTTLETQIRNEMLAALQSCDSDGAAPFDCAADLEVVASVPFFDLDTIVGVQFWQWAGLRRVDGLTVMRVDERPGFAGCPILPMTIRLQQYSVYPTDYEGPARVYRTEPAFDELQGPGDPPGPDPVALFPAPEEFDYPEPPKQNKVSDPSPPVYRLAPGFDGTNGVFSSTTFIRNLPGEPLSRAKAGYVYWAREEVDNTPVGNLGWLTWRDESGNTSTPVLAASLDFPGNFTDPVDGYPTGLMDYDQSDDPCPSYPDAVAEGYDGNNCGNGDGRLVTYEWAANSVGNKSANAIHDAMEFYVNNPEVTPFLIIYDETNSPIGDPDDQLTGANLHYRVYEFAKVRVLGYKLSSSNKWVLFEFLGWGDQCMIEQ